MMKKPAKSIAAKARKIKLLLLDVDGVMTDGSIILDNQGNETKAFHVRDGRGIKLLQQAGIAVGIITGRSSNVVNIRAHELGITEIHQGARDKLAVYQDIMIRLGLRDDQVAYMGDDDVDVPVLRRVALAAAPGNADPGVKPHVDLITRAEGGKGAVRELVNIILKNVHAPRSA